MAYTIPIPESALHTLLLEQLPSFVNSPEIGFVSGRMTIAGRLRKLGMAMRFVLEFEPSASGPDEATNALDWRVCNLRPFLARWILRLEFRRRASRSGFRMAQGMVVRVSLDALLEDLPAWRRLPPSVRAGLRLQHWWMPNDGRGVFLVFTRHGNVSDPVPAVSGARSAGTRSQLLTNPGKSPPQ